MWLKVVYDEKDILRWPNKLSGVSVALCHDVTAPVEVGLKSFRVSPIFPLDQTMTDCSILNTTVNFYNFLNAYRILGKVEKFGSKFLKSSTFFSIGLSSVIIITDQKSIVKEFEKIADEKPSASESWIIKNSEITKITYHIEQIPEVKIYDFTIVDYSTLQTTERALIDEFHISVRLLAVKLTSHMPTEVAKIKLLVNEVNTLITTLNYLSHPKGKVPNYLSEYSVSELRENRLNSITRNQILDRIIQVNSALSYVSTQAFSGAVPILERRSLVRRHSLLGIGSAILALNNIARFVESCFAQVPINNIITKTMAKFPQLSGLESLIAYDKSEWSKSSIGNIASTSEPEDIFLSCLILMAG